MWLATVPPKQRYTLSSRPGRARSPPFTFRAYWQSRRNPTTSKEPRGVVSPAPGPPAAELHCRGANCRAKLSAVNSGSPAITSRPACALTSEANTGSKSPSAAAYAHPVSALSTVRRTRTPRIERARYGVSDSIWISLLVCWPSVHMLESTPGIVLFCTSSPMDLRNTRYQADATPYLGRTCTGWIAPASSWRTHSITSSARSRNASGIVRPSAFAVLRLITVSYLIGACTGRSDGFSPLRMRST
jgi:hypothetical protein